MAISQVPSLDLSYLKASLQGRPVVFLGMNHDPLSMPIIKQRIEAQLHQSQAKEAAVFLENVHFTEDRSQTERILLWRYGIPHQEDSLVFGAEDDWKCALFFLSHYPLIYRQVRLLYELLARPTETYPLQWRQRKWDLEDVAALFDKLCRDGRMEFLGELNYTGALRVHWDQNGAILCPVEWFPSIETWKTDDAFRRGPFPAAEKYQAELTHPDSIWKRRDFWETVFTKMLEGMSRGETGQRTLAEDDQGHIATVIGKLRTFPPPETDAPQLLEEIFSVRDLRAVSTEIFGRRLRNIGFVESMTRGAAVLEGVLPPEKPLILNVGASHLAGLEQLLPETYSLPVKVSLETGEVVL